METMVKMTAVVARRFSHRSTRQSYSSLLQNHCSSLHWALKKMHHAAVLERLTMNMPEEELFSCSFFCVRFMQQAA